MSKHRVLITGVARFLGLRLAKRFENDPEIEHLIGVDVEEPPVPIEGLEFIRADIRSPLIARVVETTKADTIVHTNIASSPGSLGGRSAMKENNVIGTMQLLAAAQRADHIKKVVMKSSGAVYGFGPGEPSVIPEDHGARHVDLSGYGRDCAEAETYVRDFGRRRKDVELVVLRTQNVVGPTIRTGFTNYLSLPVVPTALGFDPRLQFLHEEDAVEALRAATLGHARGIFNVAADGVVYLSQAIRLMGRLQLPLFLPAANSAAELLKRFRMVDFPADQLKLLVYGRVVATRRFKEAFDFVPRFTTRDAVLDLRERDEKAIMAEPGGRPTWERELLGYLERRADLARGDA